VKAKIQKVLFFVLVAALIALGVRAAVPKKVGPQVWTPGCVSTVPRSWGQFKGGSAQSGLAFEDPAGTLRFVTNYSVRWNSIRCAGDPANSGCFRERLELSALQRDCVKATARRPMEETPRTPRESIQHGNRLAGNFPTCAG
jgi:hypothetical protein